MRGHGGRCDNSECQHRRTTGVSHMYMDHHDACDAHCTEEVFKHTRCNSPTPAHNRPNVMDAWGMRKTVSLTRGSVLDPSGMTSRDPQVQRHRSCLDRHFLARASRPPINKQNSIITSHTGSTLMLDTMPQ